MDIKLTIKEINTNHGKVLNITVTPDIELIYKNKPVLIDRTSFDRLEFIYLNYHREGVYIDFIKLSEDIDNIYINRETTDWIEDIEKIIKLLSNEVREATKFVDLTDIEKKYIIKVP